jgi:probable rRNA maturation factor
MASINFFSESISFKLTHPVKIRRWLIEVAATEGVSVVQLNYIFCSDDYLLQINKDYLNHETYTDIVTFDNSEEANELEGDIFLSIPRVRDNANQLNQSFDVELKRVMVHGLLHLVGYKDKSAAEKRIMREKEDHYLSLYAERG